MWCLGKPAGPEIDLIDIIVEGRLQPGQRAGVGWSAARTWCRASSPSASRVSFRVPSPRSWPRWMLIAARSMPAGGSARKLRKPVDNAGIHGLRRIGGEVAQEAVGAAEGVELGQLA